MCMGINDVLSRVKHQGLDTTFYQMSHLANVRVGCIRIYAFVFNYILEGTRHEAAVAPVVSEFLRAVHQVLRT